MAEPNGVEKLNHFLVKIWDEEAQEYRPIYIAPDATDQVQGDVFLTDDPDFVADAASGRTALTPKALKSVMERIKIVTTENDGLITKLPGDERMVFNGTGVWEEIHGQGKLYMFEVDENGDLWQLYYDENEKDDFELTEDKDLYAVYDEDSKLLLGNLMGPAGPAGERGEPGPQGEKGDPGDDLKVLDTYDSYQDLVTAHPLGENAGDAYIVDGDYYIWNGSQWKDAGQLQGAQGPQGEPGVPGDQGPKGDTGNSYYFAFDVNEDNDLILTYDDEVTYPPPDMELRDGDLWMNIEGQEVNLGNVKGDQGDVGPVGPEGPQGLQGDPGKSLVILDIYDTLDDLKAAHLTGDNPGDAYLADGNYYFWNGEEWKDGGPFSGGTMDTITNPEIDALLDKVYGEA